MASVLHATYTVETATGTIAIPDFISQEKLSAPSSVTHVSFRSAFVNLDLATGFFNKSYSPINSVLINQNLIKVPLIPEEILAGSGIQLYLLLVEFFQEVNGVQYPLQSGTYNALSVVELV